MNDSRLRAIIKKVIGRGRLYSLVKIIHYYTASKWRRVSRAITWRQVAKRHENSSKGLVLHVGCGDDRRAGMLNCEYRATAGCDVVMNCSRLDRFVNESVSGIYSNAFFEHLYRNQHKPFATECCRVLKAEGWVVSLGLPDFKVVAASYLKKVPGIFGGTFDLFNAYRYTHGDPEGAPLWWLEQLHKSLLDETYCRALWLGSGFQNVGICNYLYPGESLAINLAVIATKGSKRPNAEALFEPFSDRFADYRQAASALEWTSI